MSHTDPRRHRGTSHKSNTSIHNINHEKAAWLRINDEEEKEEKAKDGKKKGIRGVYRRNTKDTPHRTTQDGPATTREFHSPDFNGRSSPARSKSVSARTGPGTTEGSDQVFSKSHRSSLSHRDSNLDLDFADKIKAFRSLIKTSPKISGNDDQSRSKSGSSVFSAHGGHVKFNSRSLEGRVSAPNEFQLTYEQDRYIMNNRHVLESGINYDRKNYSNVFVDNDSNTQNVINKSKGSDISQNKASANRIIKRPTTLTDIDTDKGRQITSILKHSQNDVTTNGIVDRDSSHYRKDVADNEMDSYGLGSTYNQRSPHALSRTDSYRTTSPLATRPSSVTEAHQGRESTHTIHRRPHSSIQPSTSATSTGISGRAHSNIGSPSPSSFSQRKDKAASLQSHLNVLGASLSSLSSIVNGHDSSDNTLEHNDVGRGVGSTSAAISSGISNRFDFSSRLTDSHNRGGRPTSSLSAVDRHFSMSPSSEFSGASIPQSTLRGSVSHFSHTFGTIRPRSDDYFMLEKLREKVPDSPRIKQTNVQGIEDGDDSVLSTGDVKSRPDSVSGSSRVLKTSESQNFQNDLSTGVVSKESLHHYVRYITRHRDTLDEYSSQSKGAKQTGGESIGYSSSNSSVTNERKFVMSSREIQTQTPLSDYSDDEDDGDGDDTVVYNDNVISSSKKEMNGGIDDYNYKSSTRSKLISRHRGVSENFNMLEIRQKEVKDNQKSHATQDPMDLHIKSSQNGARKTNSSPGIKSQTVEKSRIIRRPCQSPSRDSERKIDKLTSSQSAHRISDRSQTALGLSSSKDSLKKYAILPSKYNAKGSSIRQRPHSALEGNASAKKQLTEGRTAELMKNVHNLHKEVDKRLKSDKNKSHSVTSSLTDLFEMVNKHSDEGSEHTSRQNSYHRQGEGSNRLDTRNKTKVVIRRKSHHGPEVDIESGSERERFSCASENFISTSTPRKRDHARSPSLQNRQSPEDDVPLSRVSSKLYRHASNNDSDDIDGDRQYNRGQHHLTNGRPDSPPKSKGLSDKLRKILYSGGHSPYTSRPQYDNDSMSDRSRKERDRGRFDDDKDEDDTINDESWLRHNNNNNNNNNNNRRPGSSQSQSQEWKESKGRTISPFIKRLAYVDITPHGVERRSPMDINKIVSGRASPADVLMGYLDNPNTVRLLQKLYQADPIDREIIMIKVLYFKAWLHFSTTSKQKRLRKQALMECADTFCYQRILGLHFIVWERNARYSLNVRRASALCRRHMLSKGFRALRWSVSHSRHCKELIQTKYRMLTTRASFDIWKKKAVKQRRERMENTWQRWTQFVTEVHKIRHMQEVMDRNITEKVYTYWKTCFDKHMKQRMAFNYFRHTLYKHTLYTWSAFVSTCKYKKEKYLSAVSQYQKHLVKTTFFQIVFTFKKSKKARSHFRKQKLNEVFWSWKEASKICRTERQQDLLVSVEHCRVRTMEGSFRQWKQKMMLRKADAHANSHLYRNIFSRWIKSYHEQFRKRLEIETALERNKLHRALLTWRRNVVQVKRRHKKAVILIERCFLRSTLSMWRLYVGTKIGTRTKVLHHQTNQERKSLKLWFCLWLDKYTARLDDKKRHLLWSQSCARKLFKKWRHICHQRYLERRLEDTQPDRELRFLQTIFTRWLTSLEKRRAEEEVAENMRKNLEHRGLRAYLQTWRSATQKQLIIKPLLRQREQRMIEECFNGWRLYIRSHVDCRNSKADFLKIRTQKCFIQWRRQYIVHQVEKRIKNQFSQGLVMSCFEEWKLFIQLKKRGHHFRHKRLEAKTFYFWKDAAAHQIAKRILLKEEETNNLDLKRECFVAWWECVHQVKSTEDACVTRLTLIRGRTVLANSFGEWKRLLHSTLIARAYQKMFHQRLVLTILLEWRAQVVNDVHSAVGVFQEKIGLAESNNSEMLNSQRLSSTLKEGWQHASGLEDEFGMAHIQEDDNMKMSVSGSLSSSLTTGLFSRLLDENSSIDSDTDRSFLLSGGLQDAALSHQARCNRMKEIAATAVWRLRHWPICVAFQQWQEFTERQIQLKKSASRVRTVVDNLETSSAFRQWRLAFVKMKKSRQHRDHQLLSSTLTILHQNTQHCRHVKLLASRSERHLKLKVFSQYFPIWLRKTQKQRREKHAVTLWTSSTAEEIELYPLESRLETKLNDRTLRLCFSLWLLKVSHIQKIRHVYHTNTLLWVFTAWREWASYRQNLMKKSMSMMCKRRIKMVFRKWCEKYNQSKQTAVLYQQAWQNYQTQILIQWHLWAKASHQRRDLLESFKRHNSQRKMSSTFTTWKSLTSKATTIQNRQRIFHLHNVFKEWCRFVQESKAKKQMTMQFQIRSYTLLVKRLFQHWHSAMVHQRTVQEKRVQEAESKALHYGRVWRRKCQSRRGKQLERMFQHRKISICLQTWQLRYTSIRLLHVRLEDLEKRKNAKLVKAYLQTWVLSLKGKQMGRDYTGRLLHSVVYEWRMFTKESRDRRKRGIALTKALQERSLHVYFQFWVAITKVKMSVRYNAETRLQMRIIREWHHYTRHKSYLRQLKEHFTQRVHYRVLSESFTKLRWRTEYCNNLQEVADKIVQDRVRATLTAVVVLWRQRLDNILAARCYGGILVVRVVRQWRRFIHRRKTEREKDMANHLTALNFHHKTVCSRALSGFRELVQVSKMAAKRRQRLCDKYALVWKTRVDLTISALEMEWDLICWRTWRRWRREFVRRQSARKIERDNNRHAISQAFKSWRKLCQPSKEASFYQAITPRSDRRISSSTSQLPVPRGRGMSSSTSNR